MSSDGSLRYTAVSTLLLLVMGVGVSLAGPPPTAVAVTDIRPQGCAPGTVVGGPNRVFNGDFAIDAGPGPDILLAAGFASDLPNRGPGVYPDDVFVPGVGAGGFSIQRGEVTYLGGVIVGRPFPGDRPREVPATETYFYSNPNTYYPLPGPGGVPTLLWRQVVTGISPNTTYNFFAYFDNLLTPASGAADPEIELRVNGVPAGAPIVVTKAPDVWVPVQYAFRTESNETELTLEIHDLAREINGDDFGMTQINLKQCVSGLGVALAIQPPVRNADGSYSITHLITLKNYGDAALSNIQVTADLAAAYARAASYQVESLTSPTLSVNPGFNGNSDKRLLSGGDQLDPLELATITLVVHVQIGPGADGSGPFPVTVVGTAQAGSVPVEDDSVPGSNPDPNDNKDPNDTVEDAPTVVWLLGERVYLPRMSR